MNFKSSAARFDGKAGIALHLHRTEGHAETECAARLVGWPAYPRDVWKCAPELPVSEAVGSVHSPIFGRQ